MVYSKLGNLMKTLSLIILLAICTAFSSIAHTATLAEIQSGVSIYANTVSASSGVYYDQSFQSFPGSDDGVPDSTPLDAAGIAAAVTGNDMSTYAWTADYHMPTGPDNAYLDLTFASNVYNGEGADLVLFFAGNGTELSYYENPAPYKFSIDVGADGNNEGGLFDVTTTTTSDLYNDKFYASYAMIDLDDFGFDQTTALGDIRIYLGDETMPALAGLGAYHLTPGIAEVPLPLSSVLFGSGLALLSVFRRKTQRYS